MWLEWNSIKSVSMFVCLLGCKFISTPKIIVFLTVFVRFRIGICVGASWLPWSSTWRPKQSPEMRLRFIRRATIWVSIYCSENGKRSNLALPHPSVGGPQALWTLPRRKVFDIRLEWSPPKPVSIQMEPLSVAKRQVESGFRRQLKHDLWRRRSEESSRHRYSRLHVQHVDE